MSEVKSSPLGPPTFHKIAVLALTALETAYFLFMWNPSSQRVDPALMLIFAAECSFMAKIATDNLAEKRAVGATSSVRMLYTRVSALGLLALMALSSGWFRVPAQAALCIVASSISAFGKVMWLRQPSEDRYFIDKPVT